MPTTIVDVAKRAGVSIGTVSNVLNNKGVVSLRLKQKVLAVIDEMGYRPNRRAQNFARDSSPTVAFVLSNRTMADPYHSRVLHGVSQECEARGYFVVFATLQYDRAQLGASIRIPAAIRDQGIVECVILGGANSLNLCHVLDELGLEYVVQANNFEDPGTPVPADHVRYDDVSAACDATQYLIDLGHRDIWYIGDVSQRWFKNRYEGYCRAMEGNGLQVRAHTAAVSDVRYTNGLRFTDAILRQKQPATAIFAGADEVALGAMDACHRLGVSVPEDMSILGFDDQYGVERGMHLTTVRIDTERIGRELARLAIERIQMRHKAQETPRAPREVMVPTQLIKRDTCQPPRPQTLHEAS